MLPYLSQKIRRRRVLKIATTNRQTIIFQFGSCHFSLLVEQQLQYGLRAREGSVGGEEDGRVGEVVVSERREQSLHQSLQRSSTDTSDFAGLQLAHRVAGRQAIPFRLNKKHANYDKFKQKPPETYSTAVGKSTAGTQ